MTFEPKSMLTSLLAHGGGHDIAVAYSGGLDSTVLLHSLVSLQQAGKLQVGLRALHVNHGLSPNAVRWQDFCATTCEALGVPLEVGQLKLEPAPGESLEAAARAARYAWFFQQLDERERLALAHHLDDQMETLLLRLLRGSGPGQLGMKPFSLVGTAWLIRPLLSVPRSALEAYARDGGLVWIEDESNQSLDFDRNYLRQQILPRIEARWPGYRESWQKSLQLSDEAGNLTAMQANEDLLAARTEDSRVLLVEPLRSIQPYRRRNAIRNWMLREGFSQPGWRGLIRLEGELFGSGENNPGVRFEAGCVQRYRDRLYLLGTAAGYLARPLNTRLCWSPTDISALQLDTNGWLRAVTVSTRSDAGLLRSDAGELTVVYRQGGESCSLPGRPTKTLKALLQEAGIEPWLRDRFPLLYAGNLLVCIPGIGVAQGFVAGPGEPGLAITWQRPDLLFQRDRCEPNLR